MKLLRPWTGLLLACVLPACTALPSAPVRPAVYDFGPGDLMPAPAARPALPPIVLHEIAAPVALESAAMLYRLAYAHAQQLRPYAHARWSMPPAQLVRQRLREALSRERAVLDPRETAAPLALRVELQEFSQLFNSAEQSSGLVRLRATLFAVKEGADQFLAQRDFVVQRPAASPDAPGGVRALTAATDAAVGEIGAWLRQQPAK